MVLSIRSLTDKLSYALQQVYRPFGDSSTQFVKSSYGVGQTSPVRIRESLISHATKISTTLHSAEWDAIPHAIVVLDLILKRGGSREP